MREIGVRELKATLSEVLRHVARGESVRVKVRDRPVADIVPVARRDWLRAIGPPPS
jgi:prevent-host-death family protein